MSLCKYCKREVFWIKDTMNKWQTFDDKEFKKHHSFTCDSSKPRFKIGDLIKFHTVDNGLRICRIEDISNIQGVYATSQKPEEQAYTYPYYIVRYLYQGQFMRSQKTIRCRGFDNSSRNQVSKIENIEAAMTLFG